MFCWIQTVPYMAVYCFAVHSFLLFSLLVQRTCVATFVGFSMSWNLFTTYRLPEKTSSCAISISFWSCGLPETYSGPQTICDDRYLKRSRNRYQLTNAISRTTTHLPIQRLYWIGYEIRDVDSGKVQYLQSVNLVWLRQP